jgi:hypothetical protein
MGHGAKVRPPRPALTIARCGVFDANKFLIVSTRWLMIEGPIQNVDNVIHVEAQPIQPLGFSVASIPSHDFH